MRNIYIAIILTLGCVNAVAQQDSPFHGTWYAKHTSYPFKQNGTATIFTKSHVRGYTQKLTIDSRSNYSYVEYSTTDTVRTDGKLVMSGDTLIFVQKSSNSEAYSKFPILKYLKYYIDSTHFIYSYSPIAAPKEFEEQSIFQPVEESAKYLHGEHQFMKQLYSTLGTRATTNCDTAFLNAYMINVDAMGNPDPSTLYSTGPGLRFLAYIRSFFLKMDKSLIPGKQNGEPVSGRMSFKITY
ncbi:MAG: hypothetical protein H7Y42_14895 [Chitinophagaceae bacterium]|nr:hypothetical protein [Chitinophagaceae bacterium]